MVEVKTVWGIEDMVRGGRFGGEGWKGRGEGCVEMKGVVRMVFEDWGDLRDGGGVGKGGGEGMEEWVREEGGRIGNDLEERMDWVSGLGGSGVVVGMDGRIVGVI